MRYSDSEAKRSGENPNLVRRKWSKNPEHNLKLELVSLNGSHQTFLHTPYGTEGNDEQVEGEDGKGYSSQNPMSTSLP